METHRAESMSEFLPPPAAKCISHFCLVAHATIYIQARKTRKLSSLLRRAREGVRFAKFIARISKRTMGALTFIFILARASRKNTDR